MFSVAESILREKLSDESVIVRSGKLSVGYVDIGGGEMRVSALCGETWVPLSMCSADIQVAAALIAPLLLSAFSDRIVEMEKRGGNARIIQRGRGSNSIH